MSYIFRWPKPECFDDTDQLLDWVKSHCASYITNTAAEESAGWYYYFYFGSEQDLTACILRWS
jgi:hypothetical protein